MRHQPRLLLAGVLACASLSAHAALPGAISGPWYNPAQSGHGLSIDLVGDGDRAVVIWHVFTPDGQPLTLYIDGVVDGRRIEGEAYAPQGMRFGNFDPAALDLPRWGEVEIEFDDCLNARLSWRSVDPAYVAGQMAIERLAALDVSDCRLPPVNPLPVGLVQGRIDQGVGRNPTLAEGILDREGRLWALERFLPPPPPSQLLQTSTVLAIPAPGYAGSQPPRVILAEPVLVDGSAVLLTTASYTPFWVTGQGQAASGDGEWRLDERSGEFGAGRQGGLPAQHWALDAPAGVQLVQPVNLAGVAGRYVVPLRGQLATLTALLEVDSDGGLCLRVPLIDSGADCDFAGSLRTHEGAFGLIDVEFHDLSNPALPAYRGRGWLAERHGQAELVLLGNNGTTGLALVAHPR